MDQFKKTEQLVRYFFDKRAKRLIASRVNDGETDGLVVFIDTALERMPLDRRILIQAEFMDNVARNWWHEYYSKTTYYRLKKEAMHDFLAKLKN